MSSGGEGFTGVEWELRSPEELAHTLTAGPGPGQAGELAAVWTAVAVELEAVASEYRRLAVELSADWVSEAAQGLDDRSREVSDDVYGLATRARELADRAGAHAHDHGIARAAMPKAAETAVTSRALDALESLGPGLAGILTGATDALETVQADQRRAAARVMSEYEKRTTPLVEARESPDQPRHLLPGLHARPPSSASDAASTASATPSGAASGGAAVSPAGAGMPMLSLALPSAGATASPVPGSSGAQVRPATVGSVATPAASPLSEPAVPATAGDRAGAGMPMAPMGAGAGAAAGGGNDEHRSEAAVRQGSGTAEIEDLYGLSIAVAPPVFGGAGPASPEFTAPELTSAGGERS